MTVKLFLPLVADQVREGRIRQSFADLRHGSLAHPGSQMPAASVDPTLKQQLGAVLENVSVGFVPTPVCVGENLIWKMDAEPIIWIRRWISLSIIISSLDVEISQCAFILFINPFLNNSHLATEEFRSEWLCCISQSIAESPIKYEDWLQWVWLWIGALHITLSTPCYWCNRIMFGKN